MSGGGGKSTTIQKTELPPGAAQAMEFMAREGQRQYGRSAGLPMYPGPTYAAASQNPFAQAQQQYLQNYASQTLPGMIGGAQRNLQNLFSAGDPFRDVYLNRAVQGALGQISRQFTEQVMPSFRASTAGSKAFGHSRLPILEAQLGERLARSMGDTASSMYSDAYGRGLQAMAAGGQLAPMLAQMGMLPGNIYGGIAQRQLSEQEAAIQEAMARYGYPTERPWELLSRLSGLAGMGGGGAGTQTSRTMGGGGSPFAGAVGGGLGGLAAGKALALPLFEAGLSAAPWTGGAAAFGGPIGLGIAGLSGLAGAFL